MGPWPGSRLAGPALTLTRRVAPGITRRCRRGLRQHWPLLRVAGCAAALRAVVLLAYRPALIFPDSERYLQYAQQYIAGHWAPDWLRTSAYSLLLIPPVLIHNLIVVPFAQHLLPLAPPTRLFARLAPLRRRRP